MGARQLSLRKLHNRRSKCLLFNDDLHIRDVQIKSIFWRKNMNSKEKIFAMTIVTKT